MGLRMFMCACMCVHDGFKSLGDQLYCGLFYVLSRLLGIRECYGEVRPGLRTCMHACMCVHGGFSALSQPFS